MSQSEYYIGQRLSLKSQSCTVRYFGAVADKSGRWLGVEWDDTTRGKHNGTHDGVKYFSCKSKSSTAASFLRPSQPWDSTRTFLQALKEKYMPDFHEQEAEIVYFSGKQAEEIGFQKFHDRQAQLKGIRVLVLDRMQIRHAPPSKDASPLARDEAAIRALCADITELDLSANLFESLQEILDLCALMPKLRVLTLDGNRFHIPDSITLHSLSNLHTLSLAQTLLSQDELSRLLKSSETLLPSLRTLNLAGNEFIGPFDVALPTEVTSLDLSDNEFTALSDLVDPAMEDITLTTLVLKRNHIASVHGGESGKCRLLVTELDLSYNAIDSFDFFDDVTITTLPRLRHLRVTGNPIYKNLVSAEGKPLSTEDGYMLTIARLPQIETLNYSKITEKERLNAETYYLGQIAAELSRTPEAEQAKVLERHPRWKQLCEDYGEPNIQRQLGKEELDPNSLAAKLVTVTFALAPGFLSEATSRSWTEEIPKSFNIYALLGLVARSLTTTGHNVFPLELHLVLETNERDPVGRDRAYTGPDWWDSSDEEDEDADEKWIKREVELVAGTRALGTFVEGQEALVRVEWKTGDR